MCSSLYRAQKPRVIEMRSDIYSFSVVLSTFMVLIVLRIHITKFFRRYTDSSTEFYSSMYSSVEINILSVGIKHHSPSLKFFSEQFVNVVGRHPSSAVKRTI